MLPTLDVIGTFQREDDIPRFSDDDPAPLTTFEGRIRLGQAIWDQQAWYNVDAAKRQLEVEEAALQSEITESLRFAVLGLIDVMVSEAEVAVIEDDLSQALELARQADERVSLGASDPIEATRAAVEVQSVRSALTLAQGKLDRDRISLAQQLNLPPGAALRSAFPLDVKLVPEDELALTPDLAEAFAMENRSEMRVSASRIAAFRASLRPPRAAVCRV